MAPLHDDPDCFAHDPERTAKAAEARRIGGLRRREESAIAVAYDLPGLDTVACTRRREPGNDERALGWSRADAETLLVCAGRHAGGRDGCTS